MIRMGKIDSDILMDIDRIKDVFVLAMDQHQKGDLLRSGFSGINVTLLRLRVR